MLAEFFEDVGMLGLKTGKNKTIYVVLLYTNVLVTAYVFASWRTMFRDMT